jgi:homocitrate synthase NifV
MKKTRHIVDTTLRDGEQASGLAFSREEKLRVAALLDRAGVYQIEAGIPVMGRREKETVSKIMENRDRAKISVWNRVNANDIRHSFDCRPDIIHVSAPVSYPHIYQKLRKNKAWLRESLRECVELARGAGYEVTVGYEDASRADAAFLISLTGMLRSLGVSAVRVADTVGILTPSRSALLIRELRAASDIPLGIHAHNDLGLAAANALAAADAGAVFVDTTLFGIGERAGNCDMRVFLRAAGQVFDIRPSLGDAVLLEELTAGIVNR